jgi:hypothetical protein
VECPLLFFTTPCYGPSVEVKAPEEKTPYFRLVCPDQELV